MRRWLAVSLVSAGLSLVMSVALAVAMYGCAHPVTITTPQGQAAYTADQVVVRINELQAAAIQANAAHALSDATTRAIVTFAVGADATLAAVPTGWQRTVATAWKTARALIPATDLSNPAIAPLIAAVDLIAASLGGSTWA